MNRAGLLFFCLFLLCAVWQEEAHAGPLAFSGTLGYNDGKGDDNEGFLQRYSLDFAEEVEWTEAMTLSGMFRYDLSDQEEDVRQVLAPTLEFSILNDIFYYNCSGTANFRFNEGSNDTRDQTWETSLENSWENPLLPIYHISFGQTINRDDQSPKTIDSISTFNGVDIEWEYDFATLYYSYNGQKGENKVAESDDESISQLVRLDLEKGYWKNRLNLAFSYQYSDDDGESTVGVEPDGTALVPVGLAQVAAAVDDTPEFTFIIPTVPALSDDIYGQSAYSIDPNEKANIVLRADLQRVDLVYAYTVEELGNEADDFRWDVYRSFNGINWTLLTRDVPYLYNEEDKRFEIETGGVEEVYFKLVSDATPQEEIELSEIEASRRVMADGPFFHDVSDTAASQLDFSAQYLITESLQFSYSLSLEDGELATGQEQNTRTQSSSLQWNPVERFSSNVSVSESRQDYSDRALLENRSYAASCYVEVLPTLDTTFGVGRFETFEDDLQISQSDSFNFYTTATLFPDLLSSFDFVYTEGEQRGSEHTNNTLSTRLRLTAWLLPNLEADLIGDYNETKSEAESSKTEGSASLNWRPSDILSVHSAVRKSWERSNREVLDVSLAVNFAFTHKMQLGVNYSYRAEEEEQEGVGLSWSWNVTNTLSMRTTGTYLRNDTVDDDNSNDEEQLAEVWQIGTELVYRTTFWE